MDIIKGILGEAEEQEPKKKGKAAPKTEAPAPPPPESGGEPVEAEIDEIANMWRSGNRDEVAERFMGMDNETCVKVIFAIGRQGALELARMVDEMLEQEGGDEPLEDDEESPGEASAEPMAVEPPAGGGGGGQDAFGRKPGEDFSIDWAKRMMGYPPSV
jgi:hypothetical protein